jgi:hypothetical protein
MKKVAANCHLRKLYASFALQGCKAREMRNTDVFYEVQNGVYAVQQIHNILV